MALAELFGSPTRNTRTTCLCCDVPTSYGTSLKSKSMSGFFLSPAASMPAGEGAIRAEGRCYSAKITIFRTNNSISYLLADVSQGIVFRPEWGPCISQTRAFSYPSAALLRMLWQLKSLVLWCTHVNE